MQKVCKIYKQKIFAMIEKENEVCQYLGIPSIPKKKWDGKSSFKRGVGVVSLITGRQAYVVVSFDAEKDPDGCCRVVKVFSMEQFNLGNFGIDEVFVVPDYMDTDVDNMDFDEKSKEAAKALVNEALDLENSDTAASKVTLPENEYYFDNIHNDEEGMAFIKSYNSTNKVRGGKVPTTHESIIMRLSVIYSELNSKTKPKSKSKKK